MIAQALSSDGPPVLFHTLDGPQIYSVPLDRSGYSVAITATDPVQAEHTLCD